MNYELNGVILFIMILIMVSRKVCLEKIKGL